MGANVSQLPADTPKEIFEGLKLLQAVRLYTVASLTVAVWDLLINFRNEYERIWKSKWSWVKVFYLISRYVGLAAIGIVAFGCLSHWDYPTCVKYNRLMPGISLISAMAAECILGLRTAALWQKNLYVTSGVIVLLMAQASTLVVSTLFYEAVVLPPGVTGCFSGANLKSGQNVTVAYWICLLVGDAVFFVLSAYKAVEFWRRGSGATPLIRVLIVDGTLLFACLFVVNLINTAFYAQSNPGLQPMNAPFSVVATSILGCRLVLNLRSQSTVRPMNNLKDLVSNGAPSGIPLTSRIFRPRPAARRSSHGSGNDQDGRRAIQVDIRSVLAGDSPSDAHKKAPHDALDF